MVTVHERIVLRRQLAVKKIDEGIGRKMLDSSLLLLCSLDETAQEGSGTVQARTHRSDRATHYFRNLLVTIFFDIRKDDDLALIGGEFGERFGKRFSELAIDVVVDRVDGEGSLASKLLGGIVFGYLFMETPFTSP